ncbi:hypothetical protein GE278_08825 [Enterobacteriaceae bacterium Kacie_13]|nr:hypothetical protein GE278_08825 [Enterobacteriaceae bacterium Kacie_13]
MEKYLYLTQYSWSHAWLDGGKVPLFQSSTYKRSERHSIFTPDENLIDSSTHDVNVLKPLIVIEGDCDVTITGDNTVNGKPFLTEGAHIKRKYEDGLVLCLANSRSNLIARKLRKSACVKILDVESLKAILDEQIEIEGQMGECTYTATHERGHFLKSNLDAWQDEFRIFWPNAKNMEVIIPPKVAQRVTIKGM